MELETAESYLCEEKVKQRVYKKAVPHEIPLPSAPLHGIRRAFAVELTEALHRTRPACTTCSLFHRLYSHAIFSVKSSLPSFLKTAAQLAPCSFSTFLHGDFLLPTPSLLYFHVPPFSTSILHVPPPTGIFEFCF